jgi:hypothetical protein
VAPSCIAAGSLTGSPDPPPTSTLLKAGEVPRLWIEALSRSRWNAGGSQAMPPFRAQAVAEASAMRSRTTWVVAPALKPLPRSRPYPTASSMP